MSPKYTLIQPLTVHVSFLEATISVICSSMPSAAKTWNEYLIHTSLVRSLRSRLGSSGSGTYERKSLEDGEEKGPKLERPKEKKKRGLYSIGTFPTIDGEDATQTGKGDIENGIIRMDRFEFESSGAYREEEDSQSNRTLCVGQSSDQFQLLTEPRAAACNHKR